MGDSQRADSQPTGEQEVQGEEELKAQVAADRARIAELEGLLRLSLPEVEAGAGLMASIQPPVEVDDLRELIGRIRRALGQGGDAGEEGPPGSFRRARGVWRDADDRPAEEIIRAIRGGGDSRRTPDDTRERVPGSPDVEAVGIRAALGYGEPTRGGDADG